MIKTSAKVISWHQGLATLEISRLTGCSACKSVNNCGTALFKQRNTEQTRTIVTSCSIALQPGELVELSISQRTLFVSTALVYLLPLIGLFVFAAWFNVLFAHEIASVIGGFLGIIFSAIVAKKAISRLNQHITPIITRRCSP